MLQIQPMQRYHLVAVVNQHARVVLMPQVVFPVRVLISKIKLQASVIATRHQLTYLAKDAFYSNNVQLHNTILAIIHARVAILAAQLVSTTLVSALNVKLAINSWLDSAINGEDFLLILMNLRVTSLLVQFLSQIYV